MPLPLSCWLYYTLIFPKIAKFDANCRMRYNKYSITAGEESAAMDKPMNEYAADAPRVLRDFLTYISTIRGKSAKPHTSIILICGCFFAYSSTTKAQSIKIFRLMRSTSATLIWILSVISRCRTPMIIWNTWRRAAQLSRTATTPITD